MNNFKAHRLRFVTEVRTEIELNEHQGSAIRGALFHALRHRFCGNPQAGQCAACPLVATCPVATLVSTLKPGSDRGRDVPRPYTVQPPLPGKGGHMIHDGRGRAFYRYRAGEPFTFGLTLYAQALQLFPYVVLAMAAFEENGIGRKLKRDDGRWLRGTLAIREAWTENPLSGERQSVMEAGDQMVQVPDVPITHQQVCEWAHERIANGKRQITIHFLTPTRITRRKHLVKPDQFRFQPFFQRLMERLESLSRDFSSTPLRFTDPRGLIDAAGRVKVTTHDLSWEELRSYSTRRRTDSPTSGLLGSVVLETDDWRPFWPWLVWGQFVHVGKDAVKGNGMYRMEDDK